MHYKKTNRTHLKDFKSCNIQDADEVLLLKLGLQSLVDTSHEPLEHAVVDCLCQASNGIHHLKTSNNKINLTLYYFYNHYCYDEHFEYMQQHTEMRISSRLYIQVFDSQREILIL